VLTLLTVQSVRVYMTVRIGPTAYMCCAVRRGS